jgi:hypothetical protein
MSAQLRTVQGKSPEEIRAAIVEDVLAKVGPHFDAAEQRIIEASVRRALDEQGKRENTHGGRHFWRGALFGALIAAGLTLLAVAYVYERAGMWGATIERFEGANAELKQIEDAR